jgi:hypothetical protein
MGYYNLDFDDESSAAIFLSNRLSISSFENPYSFNTTLVCCPGTKYDPISAVAGVLDCYCNENKKV